MKKNDRTERLRPPIMLAFRDAFAHRDSKTARHQEGRGPAAPVLSRRNSGVAYPEREVRANLNVDLESLVNTTNLGSVIDIGDKPFVEKSILNYGLEDLVHLTSLDNRVADIGTMLRQAIVNFEPRIIAGSILIERDESIGDTELKVGYKIKGDMICDPAPTPVEFFASLEVASGKLALTRK